MSTQDTSHVAQVVDDVKAHVRAIEAQVERIFGRGHTDADRAVEAIRAHLPEVTAKLDTLLPERTAPADTDQAADQ